MIDEFKRRHLPFERWFNVRDLGGYATAESGTLAWRRFYRAGSPSRMSEADIERARELDIATILDLRRDDEAGRDETDAATTLGTAYHRLSILPSQEPFEVIAAAGISAERYLSFLEVGGEAFRAAFEVLGDPASYPIVVHCSAGKDRTGIVSAMTLEILGVPRATIETDYAMTNLERERAVAYWQVRGGWFTQATPAQIDYALSVPPEAISGFLDGLQERYGGAEAYLRGVGVSADAIQGLRRVLADEGL